MITTPTKSALTTLIQFILVATVSIALMAVLAPIFTTEHEAAVHNCQSRMSDLGRALIEYSADNDGNFPSGSYYYKLANRRSLTGMGWAGQLYPYVMSKNDFNDALGGSSDDMREGKSVAYAINENAVRNQDVGSWNNRAKTVLLYQVYGAHARIDLPDEGTCSTTGACSPSGNGTLIMLADGLFPRRVEPGTGNLGRRHLEPMGDVWPSPAVDGGSFFLFADGHVHWYLPSAISSGKDARFKNAVQTGSITGDAAGTEASNFSGTFSTK